MLRLALIDYGAGNLHSVHKALAHAGATSSVPVAVEITSDPEVAARADALVLPGQGHFRQVMEAFLASGFEPVVRRHLGAERPFLGICVGLQLLMRTSEEAPGVPGLGVLAGDVRRFPKGVSVPQMGWNQITKEGDPPLLASVPDGAFVYFANSYYVAFDDPSVPGARTHYGGVSFKSAVSHAHLHATQFHPEKSQEVGIRVLRNFCALAARAHRGAP
ncbi:imidazole glycerol phosphate synthase subunit HisH [Truepera radiovictrix]|uniref:Imidazole glycerol phosphate synthase subunit HisH n=1 Tax=Truepera radiovictrix (strain DSM 17093 / CIP 108686 / LMG 22925 / RQ-24) TaxID=649638 RepID=D7CS42_TRURR|nr:imidazole glycerol phosphate synthase subunit HisH [Truepera radiovictrix]ADI13574.1 imidazole glycerol phosphate synthase, glutamine amidotransferase subunit [Truepera radiovictrix DSM 17093]WMT57863.1 imidazole glycerol phosphate synthase subunit HisH [Truepera radiovictrix]